MRQGVPAGSQEARTLGWDQGKAMALCPPASLHALHHVQQEANLGFYLELGKH